MGSSGGREQGGGGEAGTRARTGKKDGRGGMARAAEEKRAHGDF